RVPRDGSGRDAPAEVHLLLSEAADRPAVPGARAGTSGRPRARRPDTRKQPARVGGTLDRVLGELGLDVERTRRLDAALRAALGPELAPHFELVDLRGGGAGLRGRRVRSRHA